MARLLVIKAGDTLPSVVAQVGDFDRMFIDPLSGLADGDPNPPGSGLRIDVIEAHKDEPLPSADRFDAAIISGSPHSVTAREAWADRLASWVNETVRARRPLLGVCYGHQLIAHALGGRVEKNPRGYEVGTVEIALTESGKEDPLLSFVAGGRSSITFNETHVDAVTEMPPGAVLLAKTARCPVQAFRVGDRTWCVQFHPEFTKKVMELYVEGRAQLIEKDAASRGEDPAAALAGVKASVKDTPQGPRLLARFVQIALDRGA